MSFLLAATKICLFDIFPSHFTLPEIYGSMTGEGYRDLPCMFFLHLLQAIGCVEPP